MKKFLVLFLAPVKILDDWAKIDPTERKKTEDEMSGEWKKWMQENSKSFVEAPAGAGKTKVVEAKGISDTRNDVMMYGVVQATSHDEASKLFKDHPHLKIPEATIEVMEINPLTGMN